MAVYSALGSLGPRSGFVQALGELLAAIALGAVTYAATVLLLWQLAGRPQGAESWLIDRIKPLWARLTTRDRSAG
jgi:hypothetical protein